MSQGDAPDKMPGFKNTLSTLYTWYTIFVKIIHYKQICTQTERNTENIHTASLEEEYSK